MSEDQGSVKSEDSLSGRAKFLCSYGGRIMPRPHDGQLRYVGGETRILSVHRNIPYIDLISKLKKLCPYENVILKYQLPNEDLDALVSVVSDEDLDNMMEEYEKIESADSTSRLRLFLFPAKSPESPNNSTNTFTSTENKFVDALNGVYRNSNLLPLEEQKRVVLVPQTTVQAVPQVVQVVPPSVQPVPAVHAVRPAVQALQQTPVHGLSPTVQQTTTVQATVHALPTAQPTPIVQHALPPRTVQPTVPAAAAVPSIQAVPPTLPTVQPTVPTAPLALPTGPAVLAVPPTVQPTVQPALPPVVQPALPTVPTVPQAVHTVPSALPVRPVVPQAVTNLHGAGQVMSFVPATQKVVRMASPAGVSGRPQVLRTAYIPLVGGVVPKGMVLRLEDEQSEQSVSSQNSQVTESTEGAATDMERLNLPVSKAVDTHFERYRVEHTPGILRPAPGDVPMVGQVVSQLNRQLQFTGEPRNIMDDRFAKQTPVLHPLNGIKGSDQVDAQLMHKGMNMVSMNQFKVP